MLATLPEKTGRSVDEWIAALEASGAASGTHTEQREWLQSQGLGRNHAGAVLWWRKNGAAIQAGGDSLVDEQYSGKARAAAAGLRGARGRGAGTGRRRRGPAARDVRDVRARDPVRDREARFRPC
jgi:hypothetical protein